MFVAFAYLQFAVDFSTLRSTQMRENIFQLRHGLHCPLTSSQLSLSALLASGAHFGHFKSLVNPNPMPYPYGLQTETAIIDLNQTLPISRHAAQLIRSVTAKDGIIIFAGTQCDLRPIVRKAAERIGPQENI